MYANRLTGFTLNLCPNCKTFTIVGQSTTVNTLLELSGLSTHSNIRSIDVSSNFFPGGPEAICSGNWPSSLTSITINQITGPNTQLRPISAWTKSFSTCTQLKTLNMRNNALTRTSVDFIICNIKDLVISNNITGGTLNLTNQASAGTADDNNPPSGFISITNKQH
jgi:hypothetical protein